MKLSNKQKSEILKVYNAYWDGYLKGDIAGMAALLDPKYTQVGSAETEVFFNKKDAVKFLHDTIHQVAGQLEMRKRVIRKELLEASVLINEVCDLYAKSGRKWVFFSKFRASTTLQEKSGKWKIIHQHSSFPDLRAQEGENIALEKVEEENVKLKDAIKRRTIELEEKNRALEIETALERVRAQAMAMRKPEDLTKVCEVLYKQLLHLAFMDMRNSMINIHNDAQATFVNYDYSDEIGISINHLSYNIHPVIEKQIKQIRKTKDAFSETVFAGDDLKAWKKFRKKIGEKDDPRIAKTKALYYYFYSIGVGSIGISTFKPIEGEQLKVLKQFRNVFNLAYQRYTDIAQAEAQAREAKIEAALEKVRSRSLAMHNSSELKEVAAVLRYEMGLLGVEELETSSIYICNDALGNAECWYAIKDIREKNGKLVIDHMNINLKETWVGRKMLSFFTSDEKQTSILMRGENRKEWINYCATKSTLLQGYYGGEIPERTYHVLKFSNGYMGAASPGNISGESWNLLQRVTAVFSFAYTRFLDLQKAEAQAREAQIETALEKVRSRTMAMQRSDELSETAWLLSKQFQNLGESILQITIGIVDTDSGIIDFSATDPKGNQSNKKAKGSVNEPSLLSKIYAVWLEKGRSLTIELAGNDLKAWITYRNKMTGATDTEYSGIRYVYIAFFSKGFMSLSSPEPRPKEVLLLLERFASVFDSTYTRFLDLKKAEGQAREAKIEASLERLRARSMGMHKSEELTDVITLLNAELLELGVHQSNSVLMTDWDIQNLQAGATLWSATSDKSYPKIHLPDFEHVVNTNYQEAWKKKKTFYAEHYSKKEKDSYLKLLFKHSDFGKMPEDRKKLILEAKGWSRACVQMANSGLFVQRYSDEQFSVEELNLIGRFGKVFEQAYTRFLDLQKAEAQAREAQIETALERVRSRTMAMHRSDELSDIARVLFQQFVGLGESPNRFFIGIVNDEAAYVEIWLTEWGGTIHNNGVKVNIDKPSPFTKIYKAWKAKQKSASVEIKGADLVAYNKFLKSANLPLAGRESVTTLFNNVAFFSKGCIGITAFESLSAETIRLLERFASVFDSTYTRFLDLQKAETQTREAQIEVAVERVRAKALSMHKSEEIISVAKTLRIELDNLKIPGVMSTTIYIRQEDGRIRFWDITTLEESDIENHSTLDQFLRLEDCPSELWFQRIWRDKKKYFIVEQDEHDLETSMQWIKENVSEEVAVSMVEFFKANNIHHLWHPTIQLTNGRMNIDFLQPPPVETESILVKMGAAFDLAYKRFLDLQKAEAQAREAKIETALERVRSHTMAMHKSEDLLEVIQVLAQQFEVLGFKVHSTNFNTTYREKDWNLWLYNPGAPFYEKQLHIPYFDHPYFNRTTESLQKGLDFQSFTFIKEEKDRFLDHLYANTIAKAVSAERKKFTYDAPGFAWSAVYLKNTSLTVANYDAEPYSEEQNGIIRRFGNVFEQTYTRFLDLQKAEAQAREAQIEAALERVRSRSMAMHKSDELLEVINVVSQQLQHLGVKFSNASFGINNSSFDFDFWVGAPGIDHPFRIHLPYLDSPIFNRLKDAKTSGHSFFADNFSAIETKEWMHHLFANNDIAEFTPQTREYLLSKTGFVRSSVLLKNIILSIINYEGTQYSDEENDIFIRFANAFEQAYIRFLDLQKAEAQAREAQIENALEKVRSRSLAMHKSDELHEIVGTVFERLKDLELQIDAAAIFIFKEDHYEYWFATTEWEYPSAKHLTHGGSIIVDDITNAREAKVDFISTQYSFTEKNEFFHYIFEHTDFKSITDDRKKFLLECEAMSNSIAIEKNSGIQLNNYSGRILSEHENNVLKRFARVFEQAYMRFLDLQKAEAQAREAEIEAALERVRGKAMSMHNSNDLLSTAGDVFTELRKLGINPIRCGVGLLTKDSTTATLYRSIVSEKGDEFLNAGTVVLEGHPAITEIYDSANRGEPSFPVLKGELLKAYYEKVLGGAEIPGLSSDYAEYGYFLSFSEGFFYGWSGRPIDDQEIKILNRFKAIIDLTFRRYIELQNAEKRAREAVRTASLDRVRAEIASMRTTEDLNRITPLVSKELLAMEVPFIRCGVFIIDESINTVRAFLSAPDGHSLGVMNLPYDSSDLTKNVLDNWQRQVIYKTHWNREQFLQNMQTIIELGQIQEATEYQGAASPPESLHLHFINFKQGMLYVGNVDLLSTESIESAKSLADSFAIAYARYEDFKQLEAAKKSVDATLTELKSTQSQLIQSEKMASLGELTAGIAHEIQNPLNFVNNFSEVNKEMLEELKAERSKPKAERDDELENELINDVIANQEKINHHGKRADAIVKGMLQHSRSSSGVREPTDINALADEYLRLAYHGLRAKDKSFNATMNTDFDATIGNINIMPQDIGRVILNLITNAFYVVNEKKKEVGEGYSPTISVSTKKMRDHVEVRVADNGKGIPQKVLDKIFQPFFTTKPTGQGTGLGLSISYDIVKAHGGELKVETNDGKGSEFIITIPC